MKSFKKSILNVCNKLISTAVPEVTKDPIVTTSAVTPTHLVLKQQQRKLLHHPTRSSTLRRRRSSSRRRSCTVVRSSRPSTTQSQTNLVAIATAVTAATNVSPSLLSPSSSSSSSSSSSGYGTSSTSATTTTTTTTGLAQVQPPLQVFVNLDNYFYDENFTKYTARAQESALEQRRGVVQCLLDYEADYLSRMKRAIECGVRPLSVLVSDATMFFAVFQNIEKICSITEFVKTAIDDSMLLTMDIYKSTLAVIHEYISIIASAYDLYVRGYPKAVEIIQTGSAMRCELAQLHINTASTSKSVQFDPSELIRMPMDNLGKMYCAFNSLLDMTPLVDQDDYDKLSSICAHLRELVDLINTSAVASSVTDVVVVTNEINTDTYTDADTEIDADLNTSTRSSSSLSAENYDEIKEITIIKYDLPSATSRKSLDRRFLNRRSLVIPAPSSTAPLPNDYTDYDGYKHYFL